MISLDSVSIDFPLRDKVSLKDSLSALGEGIIGGRSQTAKGKRSLRALEDVSFVLEPGDRLALLGHNGAGKTTLLRTMAGIYKPTSGCIHSTGKISSVLNLGFGIDPEASGYKNIYTRGLYLGMGKSEIRGKFKKIAEFSGLGNFLEQPVRTYSAGMKARLAFAVSTHVDPDILLLDEVVATGDRAFIEQARDKLLQVAGEAKILVLASHSNSVLKELCDKGVLLEKGKVRAFGPIEEVIAEYSRETLTDGVSIASRHQDRVEKRILLINDTGDLSNPGCRAVRKAYKLLFRNVLTNHTVGGTLPVGYGMGHFESIALSGRESIMQESGSLPRASTGVPELDLTRWAELQAGFHASNPEFSELARSTDVAFINGEGSIHHNSKRGLAILAMAKTLSERNIKVVLLNTTIQEMSGSLLCDVLPRLALIHVREQASERLLATMGIESVLAPDLAYMALEEESSPRIQLLDADSHILVTAGVASGEATIERIIECAYGTGLRPVYLCIGDGGETANSLRVCRRLGVPHVEAGAIGVKELIGFLKQFPMAVSGRHHINIYLMRAGVPFVPLPSNTWKIEGNLKLVGYPMNPVSTFDELQDSLKRLVAERIELGEAGRSCFRRGQLMVENLFEKLEQ